MRIVSGKYRSVRFSPPQNISARPTTDFAKEGLFNTLSNIVDFDGIRVLDLFAGTGSISYEFISRGAHSVIAVEMSPVQIGFIKSCCDKLKIDNLYVYRSDVFKFLSKTKDKFDVIFADPPYQLGEINELPDIILEKDLLQEDGILIVEHGKHTSFEEHSRLVDSRKYGNVHFSFFR